MDDHYLNLMFNPAWIGFLFDSHMNNEEFIDKTIKRRDFEKEMYPEIVKGLEEDLKQLGQPITFAVKILIVELANNLILYSRIKFHMAHRNIIQNDNVCRLDTKKQRKMTGETSYFYDIQYAKEGIHPLYDGFLFKLQKSINNQLKLLGLLPEQVIQRERIKVVERLKKKLVQIENPEGKYDVEMVYEKN
tara:strand:+ start:296 stop:865 length:570 start_codon:yes stop_codon:yes gene_type:complete